MMRRATRRLLPAWAAALVCLALAACSASPTATAVPIATQVALRLTLTAAVPTATVPSPTVTATASPAPPTATATASSTPTDDSTPTITPTPTETGTTAPPPRATVALSSLPLPPAGFGGSPHFYIGSPGGGFIASSYRYGSVGPGQFFAPHHGVDLSTPAGDPLVAVAPGIVYYAGSDPERMFGPQTDFYGNLVVLQLSEAWNGRAVFALYGHMDQVLVQAGQPVNTGEVLGTVGATGVALGAHAHLEVRLDNPDSYWATRNPELWLTPGGGAGALAVRVTNANGNFLPGVRINYTCADGAQRFMETYWYSGVNPDDAYGENAAATNIPAGYCDLEAIVDGQTLQARGVLVSAGSVAFAALSP